MLVLGQIASGNDLTAQTRTIRRDAALAERSEGVLFNARDAVFVSDAFRGLAHADLEQRVGQAIDKHRVLQ